MKAMTLRDWVTVFLFYIGYLCGVNNFLPVPIEIAGLIALIVIVFTLIKRRFGIEKK